MPTIYVDNPFVSVVRDRMKRMERQAKQDRGEDVYVSEREALETMLSDEALEQVERERGNDV